MTAQTALDLRHIRRAASCSLVIPAPFIHRRMLAMLDEKSKGKEVPIAPPAPQGGGKVVDIMEVLSAAWKESLPKRNQ
jgi:hypothetical protein